MKNSRLWLMMLGLGLIVVFVILAYLLFSQNPRENALPTLIAMATLTPSEVPSETATATPSPTASETPTIENTATPTSSPSPEPSATEAVLQASSPEAGATSTVSVTTAPNVSQPNPATATRGSSGAFLVPTLNPSATPTPTNTLQAGITAAPPTATLDATGLVPFNQPLEIGVGSLRLLSMTMPDEEVMLSFGGSIPPIQANQQWVVVELFLICPSTTNCAPSADSFRLQSTSAYYSQTPLSIESAFGELILGNQVLGHIAYVIPRNESPFALELNLNGQVYRFALQ